MDGGQYHILELNIRKISTARIILFSIARTAEAIMEVKSEQGWFARWAIHSRRTHALEILADHSSTGSLMTIQVMKPSLKKSLDLFRGAEAAELNQELLQNLKW